MLLLGTILCLVVQPHAAGRFDTLLQLRADETAYFADRLHASPLGVEKNYGSVAQRGVFATENNGNIREQRIWALKADNGYLNLRQTYDFDGLNRLTVMGESVLGGGSGGGSWTETNGYDRWGNRWAVNSGPQSYLTPMESGWIESSTNRVTVARLVPTGLGVVSYYGGGQLKNNDLYLQEFRALSDYLKNREFISPDNQ